MNKKSIICCAAWAYAYMGPLGLGLAYIGTYLAFLAGLDGVVQVKIYCLIQLLIPLPALILGYLFARGSKGCVDSELRRSILIAGVTVIGLLVVNFYLIHAQPARWETFLVVVRSVFGN